MVRTSGGIRISAGKSSKKGGGGNVGGNSSRSTPSTPSAKSSSSSKGGIRLPPIPHCEAPSWQKPITNFFNSDAGPSKSDASEVIHKDCKAGHSKEKDGTDVRIDTEVVQKTKDVTNGNDDGQLPEKRRKQDEINDENASRSSSVKLSEDNAMEVIENETSEKTNDIKDPEKRKQEKIGDDVNIGGDSKISKSQLSENNAMKVTKNEEAAGISKKQSTDVTDTEGKEKTKDIIEKKGIESDKSTISNELLFEKQKEKEDNGMEITKNEEAADISKKQSTYITNMEAEEKTKDIIETDHESDKSTIPDELSLEKQKEKEEKGKENIDSNSSN